MTPERMAEIHAACFDGAPRPWLASEFQDYLDGASHVLTHQDCGLAVVQIAADLAELLTIAVDPAHRQTGVGRALMDRAVELAQSAGCNGLILEVAENNPAALALYRRFGFAQVGHRKDYYSGSGKKRSTALVLRKNLASES